MKYSASKDWLVKVITFVIILIAIFTGYLVVSQFYSAEINQTSLLAAIITFVLIGLLILMTYLFAPKGYRLDSGNLHIIRPLGDRIIPLSSITKVEHIPNDKHMFGLRTFGVGGLFGYYGHYRYKDIGSVQLFATQRTNRILIHLQDDKKILITPDDLSLLEKLKQAIGQTK